MNTLLTAALFKGAYSYETLPRPRGWSSSLHNSPRAVYSDMYRGYRGIDSDEPLFELEDEEEEPGFEDEVGQMIMDTADWLGVDMNDFLDSDDPDFEEQLGQVFMDAVDNLGDLDPVEMGNDWAESIANGIDAFGDSVESGFEAFGDSVEMIGNTITDTASGLMDEFNELFEPEERGIRPTKKTGTDASKITGRSGWFASPYERGIRPTKKTGTDASKITGRSDWFASPYERGIKKAKKTQTTASVLAKDAWGVPEERMGDLVARLAGAEERSAWSDPQFREAFDILNARRAARAADTWGFPNERYAWENTYIPGRRDAWASAPHAREDPDLKSSPDAPCEEGDNEGPCGPPVSMLSTESKKQVKKERVNRRYCIYGKKWSWLFPASRYVCVIDAPKGLKPARCDAEHDTVKYVTKEIKGTGDKKRGIPAQTREEAKYDNYNILYDSDDSYTRQDLDDMYSRHHIIPAPCSSYAVAVQDKTSTLHEWVEKYVREQFDAAPPLKKKSSWGLRLPEALVMG